ncbi:MAG: peptidyl-prolyl cis-trans isomerase [Candidatus Latescibacterota bacterium]|nr:MAG: peptidyl-prolyl cis-trans isomerase [Candidatus Latescibacterota bacterium]
MRLPRRARWILALALLAGACNQKAEEAQAPPPEDIPVVARVGGRDVTLSYYEERLEKMERKFLPDTLDMAGRHEFLGFIINKELMALKAEDLGYADDEQVKLADSLLEATFITDEAVKQYIAARDTATEEEIQRFYAFKKKEVLLKHILVPTRPEAEEILQLLQAGADFDSLASARTAVPEFASNGEPLPLHQRVTFGWLKYGQAQPLVEAAAFESPLQQPSSPVQTPYGWHIFLPFSTRPLKQPPLEDQHDVIAKQIGLRKRRVLTEEYYESILAAHNFILHEDALTIAYSKMPPDRPEPPDPRNEIKPVIDYTHQDLRMPLFELDGETTTIADFSDYYDSTPWVERPRRGWGMQGLYNWMRDRWLRPLQVEQARKDGIDKLPLIQNALKLRHEQMMVGALHSNLIEHQIPEPTEEEQLAFYEEHVDTYVDKEKRICNLIFHPRKRVIDRAYAEIEAGADFVETAIRFNDVATEKSHVQTAAFSRDDEKHEQIVPIAYSLDVNQYSEPFKTTAEGASGWVLLQVDQIIPEKPFAFEDIQEFVVRDWKNQWSENRLNELLEEWKQDYTIEIFDEVLRGATIRRDDVFVPEETSASSEGTQGGTD